MGAAVAAHVEQGQLEQPLDLAAVDQPGQRIVAGVVFHLTGQRVVLRNILDDGEHGRLTPRAAYQGAAPAAPHQAAVGTQETQFAGTQLPDPVDPVGIVEHQFAIHQKFWQFHAEQLVAPVPQDIGNGLVGLDDAAGVVQLEHAHRGLVERCAEAAFLFDQVVAHPARQQHRDQRDQQYRQAAHGQRGHAHDGGGVEQRQRERAGLRLQAAVQRLQLHQQRIAHARFGTAVGVKRFGGVGDGLQLGQALVGLAPQMQGIAEVADAAQVTEREDQAVDVARGIAPLQEAPARAGKVRIVPFQRAARVEVAQRHLQRGARFGQRGGIARRDVALQRERRMLLAARPVALADDPRGGSALQLLDQGRQRNEADRHAGQQHEAQGQAPREMRNGAAAHVPAASQHQIPPAPWCAKRSSLPAQARTGDVILARNPETTTPARRLAL